MRRGVRTESHLPIARHKTAIRRRDLSLPVKQALLDNVIGSATSVFDFGCGHGEDLTLLTSQGIQCSGWDPAFRPVAPGPRRISSILVTSLTSSKTLRKGKTYSSKHGSLSQSSNCLCPDPGAWPWKSTGGFWRRRAYSLGYVSEVLQSG